MPFLRGRQREEGPGDYGSWECGPGTRRTSCPCCNGFNIEHHFPECQGCRTELNPLLSYNTHFRRRHLAGSSPPLGHAVQIPLSPGGHLVALLRPPSQAAGGIRPGRFQRSFLFKLHRDPLSLSLVCLGISGLTAVTRIPFSVTCIAHVMERFQQSVRQTVSSGRGQMQSGRQWS